MEKLGIATAADLEIATLAQRLQQEVTGSEHMIIGRSEIAAWSRLKVRELVCAPNTVMRALPA